MRIFVGWGGEKFRYPFRCDSHRFLGWSCSPVCDRTFFPSFLHVRHRIHSEPFYFISFRITLAAAFVHTLLFFFVLSLSVVVVVVVQITSIRSVRIVDSLEKSFSFCWFHSSMAHKVVFIAFLISASWLESPPLHEFYLITIFFLLLFGSSASGLCTPVSIGMYLTFGLHHEANRFCVRKNFIFHDSSLASQRKLLKKKKIGSASLHTDSLSSAAAMSSILYLFFSTSIPRPLRSLRKFLLFSHQLPSVCKLRIRGPAVAAAPAYIEWNAKTNGDCIAFSGSD